jgi:prepilin signal peptidase PulO-like enzyme (type II secretory pathway)
LEPGSAWTALGFVLGLAGGGALAARMRGRSVLAGRRCAGCGASLSLRPNFPILSWLATRPGCPRCRRAAPRFDAALELGVATIGVAAILLVPVRIAPICAAAGWLSLLVLIVWRRRG